MRCSAKGRVGRLAGGLAEVVERDLHLLAVEEATAAAHAERHARARERLLEEGRLRVDPVEHGHARPRQLARSRRRAAPRAIPRASSSAVSYSVNVGTGTVGPGARAPAGDGGRADRAPRPRRRRPGESTGSCCPRRTTPDRRGSARAGSHRRNAGEVRRVGAGEAVDRLVGVADDAEVAAVAEPRAEQPELRGARVLELVDEEVTEPPALRGGELGVALEHVGAAGDQVVEVDQAALALLPLVVAVDRRDLGRRPGGGATGGGDRPLVAVGLHQPGLGPLDLRRQLGGEQRALAPADGQQRHQDPDLAFEEARAWRGPARRRGAAAGRARWRGTCRR